VTGAREATAGGQQGPRRPLALTRLVSGSAAQWWVVGRPGTAGGAGV